jgi:hypothetical protein
VLVAADDLVGDESTGLPLLEWGLDHGRAALCAEAVGVMETLHAMTLEHLKTRTQFGQAIGRFQALLQHRAVEMLVALDRCARWPCRQRRVRTIRTRWPGSRRSRRARTGGPLRPPVRRAGDPAVWRHGPDRGVRRGTPVQASIDLTWADAGHHIERYAGPARAAGPGA